MAPTPPMPRTPSANTIQNSAIKKCIFSEIQIKQNTPIREVPPLPVDVNKSLSFKVENVQRPISSKPFSNIIRLKATGSRDSKSQLGTRNSQKKQLTVINSPKKEPEQDSSGLISGFTLDDIDRNNQVTTEDRLNYSKKSSFKYLPSTDKSLLTNFENCDSKRRSSKRNKRLFLPVVIESRRCNNDHDIQQQHELIYVPTPQPEVCSDSSPKKNGTP